MLNYVPARASSRVPLADQNREIGVEFERTTTIATLALVAHAFLIPSRVEIWLGRRDGAQRKSLPDGLRQYRRASFAKLGYLRFGDNTATNFEAQEQRTVRPSAYKLSHLRLLIA